MGNAALTSLDGLGAVTTVGLHLGIYVNPSLVDVTALYGVQLVAGGVSIIDNTSLTDAAAQALVDEIDDIGSSVSISGNGR